MVCILDCSRYDHWRRQIQIRAVIWRGSRCRPARHRETFPFPQPKPPLPHLSPRITHPVKKKKKTGQQRMSGEKAELPLHTFCILTIQIKHGLTAVWGWAAVCYIVWCGTCDTQKHGEGERGRQVIQDYSADMSFPWTCYSCSIVFRVKCRVQPHLSAPNSPLAPINGAPWTSIDDEIMSSRCLVNAVPFFPPLNGSHTFTACPQSWRTELFSK